MIVANPSRRIMISAAIESGMFSSLLMGLVTAYDRMMEISNPLGCHYDIRADSVMESTCLLYKYFLYCHYAVGVYCLDDVEALYRLL